MSPLILLIWHTVHFIKYPVYRYTGIYPPFEISFNSHSLFYIYKWKLIGICISNCIIQYKYLLWSKIVTSQNHTFPLYASIIYVSILSFYLYFNLVSVYLSLCLSINVSTYCLYIYLCVYLLMFQPIVCVGGEGIN